jgi:hypothetical protein
MKVKNKFWVTVCFLALFSFAKAQNHVHFIVFGGFNTSHLITDLKDADFIVSQAKQSYNFGAGFRFEFAKIFYIQPEVYFTRKGGLEKIFRTVDVLDSFKQNVNMQSVDMPILFGFRFFDNNRFAIRLYGGPVVSFMRHLDVDIYKNGQLMPWSAIKAKNEVFSLQVGAGLDITRRLTFDVRYEYAFSPMLTIADFKTGYKILNLTLGLKFF